MAAATVSIAIEANASTPPTVHYGDGKIIAGGTDRVGQYRITIVVPSTTYMPDRSPL